MSASGPGTSELDDRAGRPLVVVHLMKTGGFTLLFQVMANVPRDRLWGVPDVGEEELAGMARYSSVEELRALDEQARARLDIVMGHYPFAVVDVVGFPQATIATVLRDPVDRVISYLNMCKARNVEHRDLALEAIYEDEFFGPRLIRNHQTKMLGMTAEQAMAAPPNPDAPHPLFVEALAAEGLFDSPEFLDHVNSAQFGAEMIDTPLVWAVPVDGSTLDNARRNLERVEILGLHEDFDGFLDRLGARMGWTIDREMVVNQGAPVEVSASFRREIEAGNALDLELYEHARTLVRG